MEHQEYLQLGNLDSKRDWGDARDYVRGYVVNVTTRNTRDDYVLATGEDNIQSENLVVERMFCV